MKINHYHKFETYAGASSEAIFRFREPRGRPAAGLTILLIVESSGEINKERMACTQKLGVAAGPLMNPSKETSEREAHGDYRAVREKRGMRKKTIEKSYVLCRDY